MLKERTIKVSRYSPTETEITKAKTTGSKIRIESQWKLQKDLLIDKETFDMYEKLAEIIKSTVNALKYHLR